MKWLKQAGVFKSSTEASPVRKCVSCLYSIGYGVPKIERVTGYNRGASIKWLKKCGIYAPERAAARRDRNAATAHRHKRDAKFPLVLCAFSVPCRVEKVEPYKLKHEERLSRQRDYYRANKRRIYERTKRHLPTVIARRLRHRLWKVTKGRFREETTFALVGCSASQLVAYLQSQFLPGMTWDNRSEWHIDHIKPCAAFDLTKTEEQRRCFHFTNLQPLWAEDNLRKSAKLLWINKPTNPR